MCLDDFTHTRRDILKLSAMLTAAGALPMLSSLQARAAAEPDAPVRIGYLPITDKRCRTAASLSDEHVLPTQTRRSVFSRAVVQPNPTSPKLNAPKRPHATSPNRPQAAGQGGNPI